MAQNSRYETARLASTVNARYHPDGYITDAYYLDGRFTTPAENKAANHTYDREDKGSLLALFAYPNEGSVLPEEAAFASNMEKILDEARSSAKSIDSQLNDMADLAAEVCGQPEVGDEEERQAYFAGVVVNNAEVAAVTTNSGCAFLYRGDVLYPLTMGEFELDAIDLNGNPVEHINDFSAGAAGAIRYSNVAKIRQNDCLILCNKELMEILGQREILRLLNEAEDQEDAAESIITAASAKRPGTPLQLLISFVEYTQVQGQRDMQDRQIWREANKNHGHWQAQDTMGQGNYFPQHPFQQQTGFAPAESYQAAAWNREGEMKKNYPLNDDQARMPVANAKPANQDSALASDVEQVKEDVQDYGQNAYDQVVDSVDDFSAELTENVAEESAKFFDDEIDNSATKVVGKLGDEYNVDDVDDLGFAEPAEEAEQAYSDHAYQSGDQGQAYGQAYTPQAYGQEAYGQAPYAQQAYGQGGYEADPYGQSAYSQTAYDQTAYDQTAYGQTGYDPQAYGQAYDGQEYGQESYGQEGYDPNAYGQTAYDPQAYGQDPYAQNYGEQGYGAYNPAAYGQEAGYGQDAYAQGYGQETGYDPNYGYQNTGYDNYQAGGYDQGQGYYDETYGQDPNYPAQGYDDGYYQNQQYYDEYGETEAYEERDDERKKRIIFYSAMLALILLCAFLIWRFVFRKQPDTANTGNKASVQESSDQAKDSQASDKNKESKESEKPSESKANESNKESKSAESSESKKDDEKTSESSSENASESNQASESNASESESESQAAGAQGQGESYVIQDGDSMWGIVASYYGEYTDELAQKIYDANPGVLDPNDYLRAGQTIILPPKDE